MSNTDLGSITNSFRDVRLGSLASWRRADEFGPQDRGGPYVVTQEGYDPNDATMSPDEFILRRSGEWLSLGVFFKMPEADRADFVFRTAADVMHLMDTLPAKARIIRSGDTDKTTSPPHGMNETTAEIIDRKAGASGSAS